MKYVCKMFGHDFYQGLAAGYGGQIQVHCMRCRQPKYSKEYVEAKLEFYRKKYQPTPQKTSLYLVKETEV